MVMSQQEWEREQSQYELNTMKECFFNAMNNLSRYKHIEEGLGIDLVILFKALDNGIYFKRGNEICKTDINYICKNRLGYRGYSLGAYDDDYPDIDIWFMFKDYGKTWALTKEELL